MGQVSEMFVAVEHRKPMKAVNEALAVTERGFEGCIHGRPGSKRQLLIVDSETLGELNLGPGMLRENITTKGLNVGALGPGQRLKIGTAILEVTISCEPCFRMDEIRLGLQEALRNRRGVLCRVVVGGRISRGDVIETGESVRATPAAGGGR